MSRLKIPVVLAVAIAAIGYLVVTGVSRNDAYMATLDEWDPDRAQRERVRVQGVIADASIREDPEKLLTHFVMRNESDTQRLPVRYVGVLPDLFRDGAQVVVGGRLGETGTFGADEIMTKCPSKYEGAEEPAPGTVPGHPGEAAVLASAPGDGAAVDR